MLLKKYLFYIWEDSVKELISNIFSSLEENSSAILLDCGCDEGDFTMEVTKQIKAKKVYGIDIIKERYIKAEEKDVIVKCGNLNEPFAFESEMFDVLHANQVIEHLWNLDGFIEEVRRVLKPGGYAVISTENLASWHNIFSLLLGFQPFSSTNISNLKTIGNPFALHIYSRRKEARREMGSFAHLAVLSYRGLKELFEAHNFTVEKILGAGYYPLPKYFSQILAKIDKRHSAFLTIKVRKGRI